jgi:hypothetical protein
MVCQRGGVCDGLAVFDVERRWLFLQEYHLAPPRCRVDSSFLNIKRRSDSHRSPRRGAPSPFVVFKK